MLLHRANFGAMNLPLGVFAPLLWGRILASGFFFPPLWGRSFSSDINGSATNAL